MKSTDTTLVAGPQPLTGGTAVWIFMAVELITFGMFLVGHAWGWRSDPDAWREGQALLHPASGLRGTLLLLVGSGLAYLGVLQHEAGRDRAAAAWLLAASATGAGFVVNKLVEYADPAMAGVSLSTSGFWFGYLFLTVLHLLHVIGAVLVLPWIAWLAWRGRAPALTVQAGASFWHLVDLVWLLLFPILYLVHP